MSRQSTRTFISPANSDVRPESRCGKYTDVCSERLSKMFKSEIQFQHTVESAKASVEYGFQSGLLRLGKETKRCSEVDATVAQIIALRERLGLVQKDVDRIMGYKSNMTNITERGRRNIEATKLFLQRLERIAEM